MRSSRFTTSLAIASFCSLSQAWPLFSLSGRSPEPLPAPQSYSVVAVGGGSTANNAQPSTRTITNAITQTQIQTIISTVTVDGSASPTTIIATVPFTITAEITIAETATMLVAPSVTSEPYDNGQWHTTYYKQSTLSDVLVPVSTILPSDSDLVSSVLSAPTSLSSSSRRVDVATTQSSSTTTTGTITAAAEIPSVTSSTSIDWATAYGTWRSSAVDGSWWGKD